MAIITLPALPPATSATMKLLRGDGILETFSGKQIVIQSTKALWAMSFPLRVMRIDSARAWQAALVQLAKHDNQFEITPPGWVNGEGWSGVNPNVSGASQLGTSLLCYHSSLPNNTSVAKAGDYIEITNTGEMKMLTQDASTNGVGQVTFNFEPAMRSSPGNGTEVDIKTPKVIMRMVAPAASWATSLPEFIKMNFDAIEYY